MATFSEDQARQIAGWLQKLREHVENRADAPLRREVPHVSTPSEISSLYEMCQEIERQIGAARGSGSVTIEDEWNPLIKLALLSSRRALAAQLDASRRLLVDPSVIASLDSQLAPFTELMEQTWYSNTITKRKPELTDFLTLGRAAVTLQERLRLPDQVFDEKFQILQAPALLMSALGYYRES